MISWYCGQGSRIRTSHPSTQVRSVAASANLFVCWYEGMPSLYFGFFENRKQIPPAPPVSESAVEYRFSPKVLQFHFAFFNIFYTGVNTR